MLHYLLKVRVKEQTIFKAKLSIVVSHSCSAMFHSNGEWSGLEVTELKR